MKVNREGDAASKFSTFQASRRQVKYSAILLANLALSELPTLNIAYQPDLPWGRACSLSRLKRIAAANGSPESQCEAATADSTLPSG